MTMKCEKTNIRECAIKSCEARIKHLQNAPPHYHGKRQRLREIELEKVKIAALTLTPPNEWVSVNKRLPEKRKDVLVHYGNGRIGIDWIDSTQCFVFDELYGRVTHWLPIPELPDRRPPEEEA